MFIRADDTFNFSFPCVGLFTEGFLYFNPFVVWLTILSFCHTLIVSVIS